MDKVLSPGEFAIRGSIIDIYPMGSVVPYRIDFFGNEIDSIRTFDVDTQRGLYPTKKIKLLPAREFPLDADGISKFRDNYRTKIDGDLSRSKPYKSISKGTPFAGIEWYLPLFFDETETIFDYINPEDMTLQLGDVSKASNDYQTEAYSRYRLYSHDPERPILEISDLLLSTDHFFKKINQFEQINKTKNKAPVKFDVAIERGELPPLRKLKKFIGKDKKKILICTDGLGRRESVAELLIQSGQNFNEIEAWQDFVSSRPAGMSDIKPTS